MLRADVGHVVNHQVVGGVQLAVHRRHSQSHYPSNFLEISGPCYSHGGNEDGGDLGIPGL